MGDVEADVVEAVNFHLLVDGSGHDVAWCQRQALVVFLHELFAVGQAQYAAVAAHGLGDEVGGMGLALMEEGGGVELHKLHVLHSAFGAIDHGLAVAGGNDGVGGSLIDGSAAACAHDGDFRQIGIDFFVLGIEHVGSVAVDVGRASGYASAEVVLRDNLHREMVFLHSDVGAGAYGSHQPALYLGSRVVGMVQDAELRVSAFAMQVEVAIILAVEVHAPLNQFANLLGRVAHHLLNGLSVADIVARNHGVFNVFLEVIDSQVGDRGDAALGKLGVGFVECRLTDDAHSSFLCPCYFQGIAHTGHSRTDDEEIVFVNHKLLFTDFMCKSNK